MSLFVRTVRKTPCRLVKKVMRKSFGFPRLYSATGLWYCRLCRDPEFQGCRHSTLCLCPDAGITKKTYKRNCVIALFEGEC